MRSQNTNSEKQNQDHMSGQQLEHLTDPMEHLLKKIRKQVQGWILFHCSHPSEISLEMIITSYEYILTLNATQISSRIGIMTEMNQKALRHL